MSKKTAKHILNNNEVIRVALPTWRAFYKHTQNGIEFSNYQFSDNFPMEKLDSYIAKAKAFITSEYIKK